MTVTPFMVDKEHLLIWQICTNCSRKEKNHLNSSDIIETGILILFLNLSWVVASSLKSYSRLESPDIWNGNVIIFLFSNRWYLRAPEQGRRLLLQGWAQDRQSASYCKRSISIRFDGHALETKIPEIPWGHSGLWWKRP